MATGPQLIECGYSEVSRKIFRSRDSAFANLLCSAPLFMVTGTNMQGRFVLLQGKLLRQHAHLQPAGEQICFALDNRCPPHLSY
jgi:hypothetical protein